MMKLLLSGDNIEMGKNHICINYHLHFTSTTLTSNSPPTRRCSSSLLSLSLSSHLNSYDFRYSLIDIPLISIIRSIIILCVYNMCDGPGRSRGPYLSIATMCSLLLLGMLSWPIESVAENEGSFLSTRLILKLWSRRKELVPKAQPMPYFDRPFIPRRSEKQLTVPKEPKFHFPQHKKSKCVQQSWSDTSSYISSSDACYGL